MEHVLMLAAVLVGTYAVAMLIAHQITRGPRTLNSFKAAASGALILLVVLAVVELL